MIEESPSAAISDTLRERMGRAAIKAAKAAHYVNAGTIEFLLESNEQFFSTPDAEYRLARVGKLAGLRDGHEGSQGVRPASCEIWDRKAIGSGRLRNFLL